jgi:hypothetical protein
MIGLVSAVLDSTERNINELRLFTLDSENNNNRSRCFFGVRDLEGQIETLGRTRRKRMQKPQVTMALCMRIALQ